MCKTVCRVGYEGPLCAVCSSSYSIQGAGQLSKCKKCDGDATVTIAIWTAGFALLLSLSVIFCYCRQKATAALEKAKTSLEDLEERRSNSVIGRYSEKFDEGKHYTCLKRWINSVSYYILHWFNIFCFLNKIPVSNTTFISFFQLTSPFLMKHRESGRNFSRWLRSYFHISRLLGVYRLHLLFNSLQSSLRLWNS